MAIANLALPLFILSKTHSPALAGSFSASLTASQLLLAIPAGALCDRVNRRILLISSELLRLVSVSGILIALKCGIFSFFQMYIAAIMLGGSLAIGTPVRALVLRSIVHRDQLTQALSQDEVRLRIASLLGPTLAGALFSLGRVAPLVAILGSYTIALFTASFVRYDGRVLTSSAPQARRGAFIGLNILRQDSILYSIIGIAALVNVIAVAVVLPIVVTLQRQHFGTSATGIALAGEAVGGMAGAFLTTRLHKLMPPGRLLLTISWSCVPLVAALAIPWGPIWIFSMLFLIGIGIPVRLVMIDIMIFRQVEDAIRGRVISGALLILTVGVSTGNMFGGYLTNFLSPGSSILVMSFILAVCLSVASTNRRLRHAGWPEGNF